MEPGVSRQIERLDQSLLQSLCSHFVDPEPDELENDKELDAIVKLLAVDHEFVPQLLLQLLIFARHIVQSERRKLVRVMVNRSFDFIDVQRVDRWARLILTEEENPKLHQASVLLGPGLRHLRCN
jgi:hypothetical protein